MAAKKQKTNQRILNLDDFDAGGPEIVLIIKGKEHKLKPMSVGDFIETAKMLENEEMTVIDELESVIAMVRRAFPTLPEDDVRAMSGDQLMKVLEFAQDVSRESAEGSEGNATAAE